MTEKDLSMPKKKAQTKKAGLLSIENEPQYKEVRNVKLDNSGDLS